MKISFKKYLNDEIIYLYWSNFHINDICITFNCLFLSGDITLQSDWWIKNVSFLMLDLR
jgi:hypothetical protein